MFLSLSWPNLCPSEQNESLQSKRHEEKNEENEEEKLRKIAEQVGMNLLDFAKGKATNYNILEILSGFSKASEGERAARGNVRS